MSKNYPCNVIRLRKGKKSVSQVYSIIAILNRKKTSSQKVVETLGYFKFGKTKVCAISFKRLAYYLNKGFILRLSVKKMISEHAIV
jgi:ribosomal protein S16